MKRGLIVLVLLVMVAGAAGGWWWARSAPEQATQFLVDGGLEAARAEAFVASLGGPAEAPEEDTLIASGSIEGEEVAIVSEFGGRIVRLEAEEGDPVEEGQLLVELDASGLLAQIAQAEALRFPYRAQGSMEEKGLYRVHDYQVQAAQAGLRVAQAERAGAAKTLAALRALRDSPLAMVSQVHRAEENLRIAEAGVAASEARVVELQAGPRPEDVAVAEAQVARAEAGVAALQARLDKMILRAPIAGIVTTRSAHAGEAAVPGATLLTVADLDPVHLTIYVPVDELNRVFLGQTVGVTVDSFPGRVFDGTVSHIAQEAEFTPKNVQTERERVNMVFAVKVRLPNPDHLLKPGMPADATLEPNP
jgi:multidrug resistance efflux pump